MPAAIIFDLYGTLLRIPHDSRPFHKLARRAAHYRPAIEIALTASNSSLSIFAANIGLEIQPDIGQLQLQLDDDIRKIQPFGDAITTLKRVKQYGIKTAVISNLATPYKLPYFDYQLDELVDVTVCSCDCGKTKPNPHIYQLAATQLGCEISDMAMVGDSLRCDVNGPSQMGMMGVHLVRDGRSSPAQTVITSLHSLLKKCNITTR